LILPPLQRGKSLSAAKGMGVPCRSNRKDRPAAPARRCNTPTWPPPLKRGRDKAAAQPSRRAPLCALAFALVCGFFAPAQAAAGTLLVLGDSLGAGFGLPAERGFVPRLEAALRSRGHDIRVRNGSISGDTTAGGRARLAWALSAKPDFAIVALGGNDGLRGLDPAQTRANLGAILARLTERKVPVLLAGMKAPRNLGPEYEAAFNGAYPALARRYGAVLYPFFLDGVALDPALNQPDLIHPNAAGVAVIVERILPYVEKLLAGGGE